MRGQETGHRELSVGGPGEQPTILLIMGVSGSGKTTVGALLAQRLNLQFVDADTLHSSGNIAKMSAGLALTDDDRADWLRSVAACLAKLRHLRQGGVMACSALKRRYRRQIVADAQDVRLVYLWAPIDLIRARLQERRGHFMAPALLDSQFDALEEPLSDENPVAVSVTGSPLEAMEAVLRACVSACRMNSSAADAPPVGPSYLTPANPAVSLLGRGD